MIGSVIRYTAYPLVAGGAAVSLLAVHGTAHRVGSSLVIVAVALASIALLERIAPFRVEWNRDHGDLREDLAYNLVNLALIAGAATLFGALRDALELPKFWPTDLPLALEALLVGTILDAGLYAMHRLSHGVPFLWRLHVPHHSPERLYWLNGERRHVLHAVLLAGPGFIVLMLLGAPADVIGLWFAFLAVHLALQHANIDYTVGPLRHVLGVAETHRWHHKREYEDAQVNFGEFWIVFDRIFGTYHSGPVPVASDAVGLSEIMLPKGWLAQLVWPFRRALRTSAAAAHLPSS